MSKKISQLEEKQELTGNEFVALQDGTDNKKAKVSALAALAGLPAFVLSGDLAGGNGVISSAVWERLMAARTANSPIVVINDNGSLPVANVAILGFGSNEQQQGTTDIIMPARVNDLSDYTVTQTMYQITGSGSTYNIATVTKNLKFYNSGDGTKFLANDGTYRRPIYVLNDDVFTEDTGTISQEQYNEISNALDNNAFLVSNNFGLLLGYKNEGFINLRASSSRFQIDDDLPPEQQDGRTNSGMYITYMAEILINGQLLAYRLIQRYEYKNITNIDYQYNEDGAPISNYQNYVLTMSQNKECGDNAINIIESGRYYRLVSSYRLDGPSSDMILTFISGVDIILLRENDNKLYEIGRYKIPNVDIKNDGDGTKFLSDDGTYKEISAGGVSVVEHGTADTTFTLTPNVLHKWGEVAALTLTLAAETSGVLNEYMFQFTSGTTPTVLTLPETVKWIGDSAVEASKTYQVSIVNNLAVLGGA